MGPDDPGSNPGNPIFRMKKSIKFITARDGEKIKLDKYGKISYRDRIKVIPGFPGTKKLREELKKLKVEKPKK